MRAGIQKQLYGCTCNARLAVLRFEQVSVRQQRQIRAPALVLPHEARLRTVPTAHISLSKPNACIAIATRTSARSKTKDAKCKHDSGTKGYRCSCSKAYKGLNCEEKVFVLLGMSEQ